MPRRPDPKREIRLAAMGRELGALQSRTAPTVKVRAACDFISNGRSVRAGDEVAVREDMVGRLADMGLIRRAEPADPGSPWERRAERVDAERRAYRLRVAAAGGLPRPYHLGGI